jgi:hypothetical protein
VAHEDSQPNCASQAESFFVRVPDANRKSASFETGFQIQNAEHLHRVARHGELLPDYTKVAVIQGLN